MWDMLEDFKRGGALIIGGYDHQPKKQKKKTLELVTSKEAIGTCLPMASSL
jgi:hypothetical protein